MSYVTLKFLAPNSIEVEGNLMIRYLVERSNLEITFLAMSVLTGIILWLIYKSWNWQPKCGKVCRFFTGLLSWRPKNWKMYWLVRAYAFTMLAGKIFVIFFNSYSIYIIVSNC